MPGPDAAPDLCQEVFLRLYTASVRYREEAAFATWIYRIALNVARDAGRHRRDSMPLANHQPLRDASQHDRALPSETVELVTRALADLPDSLRTVLVLRHFEGLSFEEIARLTGTPASTLKSRFAIALARPARPPGGTGLRPGGGSIMNCTQARAPACRRCSTRTCLPTRPPGSGEHLAGCPACRLKQTRPWRNWPMLDDVPAPPVTIDLPRLYREAASQQARRLRRWRTVA